MKIPHRLTQKPMKLGLGFVGVLRKDQSVFADVTKKPILEELSSGRQIYKRLKKNVAFRFTCPEMTEILQKNFWWMFQTNFAWIEIFMIDDFEHFVKKEEKKSFFCRIKIFTTFSKILLKKAKKRVFFFSEENPYHCWQCFAEKCIKKKCFQELEKNLFFSHFFSFFGQKKLVFILQIEVFMFFSLNCYSQISGSAATYTKPALLLPRIPDKILCW